MTSLECASAVARTLAARPGTPPPAEIFKTQLDNSTFVAIYAAQLSPGVQLNAHLLSAAGGRYCVEVHVAKVSIDEGDLSSWFDEIEKARIEPR